MKRNVLTTGILVSLLFSPGCFAQSVRIHTYEEMNKASHRENANALKTNFCLEPVCDTYVTVAPDQLMPSNLPPEQRNPTYPRIGILPNGQFLLTYQGGISGSRIFCSRSANFKEWSGRAKIVDVRQVTIDGVVDYQRSSNMDVAILRNGLLLGVYAFRSPLAMKRTGDGCGLRSIRSLDNGKTWTKSEVIYDGVCGNPQIVELPNGTVQVYFSDLNANLNSSCVSVIESTDYGLTFSSKKRIARQFKYYNKGIKVFTDRCPAICLKNNGQMVGLLEDRLENEPGAQSERRLSLIKNSDSQWTEATNADSWPPTRTSNYLSGDSPRILAFPSGEILTSFSCNEEIVTKFLDQSVTLRPFEEKGHYNDIKLLPDGHTVAMAMDAGDKGIVTKMACLNHAISAYETEILMDGDGEEWVSDEALFIGSDSPSQVIFRAATYGDNLYLLAECVNGEANPVVKISVCNQQGKLKKGSFATLSFDASGILSSSNNRIAVNAKTGKTINGKKGFVAEICIPLPELGANRGASLLFNAELLTKSGGKSVVDGFTGVTKDTGSWMRIELSEKAASKPFRASHSGEENFSALQIMPKYSTELSASYLLKGLPETSTDQNFTCYPRIKKMSNGEYIMFYMGGRFGSRIWCTVSPDFKTWSEPQMLFSPYTIDMEDGTKDVRRYMDADATVLQNGDVLMVSSFRATKHYPKMIGSGLVLRRSTDNGRTWSEPWEICHESNWEPTIIALPDGRVQCYFTHSNPQTLNSGTSVMTSFDNGNTWTAPMRCSRQYKYDYKETDIYTDQMPSICVLPDGKTLAGWVEARLESKVPLDYADKSYYASYYKMSLILNDGFEWKDLGEHSEGPVRRHTNVERGAGGYIDAFPSGEVAVGCGRDGYYYVKLLTSEGDLPYGSTWATGWTKALPNHGFWGTIAVDSPSTLVAAIHNSSSKGMQLARFHLNHRIDAKTCEFSNDALYLGTSNGAEAFIRASRDEDNLILKVEGYGTFDNVEIRLCSSGSDNIIVKSVSAEGGEIRVALEQLDNAGVGDYICIFATLTSGTQKAVFSQSSVARTYSWQRIRIK